MARTAAVTVGTANFRNSCAMPESIEGLEKYMEENGSRGLQEARGIFNRYASGAIGRREKL